MTPLPMAPMSPVAPVHQPMVVDTSATDARIEALGGQVRQLADVVTTFAQQQQLFAQQQMEKQLEQQKEHAKQIQEQQIQAELQRRYEEQKAHEKAQEAAPRSMIEKSAGYKEALRLIENVRAQYVAEAQSLVDTPEKHFAIHALEEMNERFIERAKDGEEFPESLGVGQPLDQKNELRQLRRKNHLESDKYAIKEQQFVDKERNKANTLGVTLQAVQNFLAPKRPGAQDSGIGFRELPKQMQEFLREPTTEADLKAMFAEEEEPYNVDPRDSYYRNVMTRIVQNLLTTPGKELMTASYRSSQLANLPRRLVNGQDGKEMDEADDEADDQYELEEAAAWKDVQKRRQERMSDSEPRRREPQPRRHEPESHARRTSEATPSSTAKPKKLLTRPVPLAGPGIRVSETQPDEKYPLSTTVDSKTRPTEVTQVPQTSELPKKSVQVPAKKVMARPRALGAPVSAASAVSPAVLGAASTVSPAVPGAALVVSPAVPGAALAVPPVSAVQVVSAETDEKKSSTGRPETAVKNETETAEDALFESIQFSEIPVDPIQKAWLAEKQKAAKEHVSEESLNVLRPIVEGIAHFKETEAEQREKLVAAQIHLDARAEEIDRDTDHMMAGSR